MRTIKILATLTLIVLLAFSCSRQKNPLAPTFDFVFSFSTESRPNAIVVEKNSGYLFISNSYHDNNRKIQKYDRQGVLRKTIVDFESFDRGNYSRYDPIDLTIGNNNDLYILVTPYKLSPHEEWVPFEGFCILRINTEGNYKEEYDFAQMEQFWHPSALAYYNGNVYVTNGKVIKTISTADGHSLDISLPDQVYTSDMAIDSDGLIYLVGQAAFDNDSVGCFITKFNLKNNDYNKIYSKTWTKSFGANVNNPGISITRDKKLYLVTFYCKSLEIYNQNLLFLAQLNLSTEDNSSTLPMDVATDQNNVYIVDNRNNLIRVYKKQM